jgi:hypothetical protein
MVHSESFVIDRQVECLGRGVFPFAISPKSTLPTTNRTAILPPHPCAARMNRAVLNQRNGMISKQNHGFGIVAVVSAVMVVITFSGCIGAMSQLMYVIKGHDLPAAYDGLVGKRVAVVTISDASAYGPDTLTYTVSRAVGIKLSQGVKNIKLIPNSEVENWVDENGWNEVDFGELGKGINADRIVAIEIGGYSIHEGPTIYKGRSDLTVTVYDLEGSEATVAYGFGPENFEYPKNGRPSIQSNDRQFEVFYLRELTKFIANQFMKHDRLESFANDAAMMN